MFSKFQIYEDHIDYTEQYTQCISECNKNNKIYTNDFFNYTTQIYKSNHWNITIGINYNSNYKYNYNRIVNYINKTTKI